MADLAQGSGSACCGTAPPSADASPVRTQFIAGAEQLGISGGELTGLVRLFDGGDCAAVQKRMAHLVGARLAAAEVQVVGQIEQAARVQSENGRSVQGLSPVVAGLQSEATELTALVARLQGAAHRLAQPPASGGTCDGDCGCVTAAPAVTAVRVPAARAALTGAASDAAADGPDLVCTIDGGLDAMHARITEWQAVLSQATGREPADGGVSLTFEHDPAVAAELARLAAVEFACCSFFAFTLAIGPAGMRLIVTAPPEAQHVVTAVYGTAKPAGARS